jgi:aminopeptidase YwaD
MAVRVSDKNVRDVLGIVREIIDAFGPRLAGTDACRKAAGDIKKRLGVLCDRTGEQAFDLHVGALWSLGFVIGGGGTLAVLFLLAGGAFSWAAVCASVLSFVYWMVPVVFMSPAFDFFFPKAGGLNVWGVIEPAGEVRRQIFVVGHHDSPCVMNWLGRFQKWYAIRIILAIVTSQAILWTSVAWAVSWTTGGADPAWGSWAVDILFLPAALFVFPLVFFFSQRVSPGAGDNLVACAMGIQVARIIRGGSRTGRLKHTRLVILSVDGEELGLRGAAAYLKAHRRELLDTKTFVLNFDAIYGIEDLLLITKDRNGFEPLSAEMTDACRRIAADLGHTIKVGPVTFGGGGTDAAVFAANGIEVASVIGISTKLVRTGLVYHTLNDTVNRLDPQAIKACMEIAVNYIREGDEG